MGGDAKTCAAGECTPGFSLSLRFLAFRRGNGAELLRCAGLSTPDHVVTLPQAINQSINSGVGLRSSMRDVFTMRREW